MKKYLFLFLFFFGCNGVHLNIQYPNNFTEGEIISSKFKNEKLELTVKTDKGRVAVNISPWKENKHIKINFDKMKLKTLTKISPVGPSKVLYFYDENERLIFIIANKVNNFFKAIEGYDISPGTTISESENSQRLWCEVKVNNINLKAGESMKFTNQLGNYIFILLGGSITNESIKKEFIASEAPPFIADYLIISEDFLTF